MEAESIKVKTCCNRRLKYIDDFIIVETKTKISNAVDITNQYKIDKATADIISELNNSTYSKGYSIIHQADLVDLVVDIDNVDHIKTLESIENLQIFIKMPKTEKPKPNGLKPLKPKDKKIDQPQILNKYADLLVVL